MHEAVDRLEGGLMNSQGNVPRQAYRVWRDWLFEAFEHACELERHARAYSAHTADLEAGRARGEGHSASDQSSC